MKTLGKEGKVVFIFGLRRRPGQEQSLSKPVSAAGTTQQQEQAQEQQIAVILVT